MFVVSSNGPLYTLSSALLGGGIGYRRHLVNAQVGHGYVCFDPQEDLKRRVEELGIDAAETAAMMTAADVGRVVEGFASGDQFRLHVFVTAGVGNAARAGHSSRQKKYPGYYTPGTINIIAVIDGRVSDAALVNAVQTVTEAKAAALQDLAVPDVLDRTVTATGTTTDSVMVAATQEASYAGVHLYMGVATELGDALATTVYQSLQVALENWQELEEEDVMKYGYE